MSAGGGGGGFGGAGWEDGGGGGGGAMEADHAADDDRDQAGRQESDLVGPRQPLQRLAERYRAGSPALAGRLDALAAEFPSCRPVAGDGNCFYRGFLFALLEALLQEPRPELLARCAAGALLACFTAWGALGPERHGAAWPL
ncbi:MAG: peptidase C65 Otubain-domain-containing protein [Monoraphidium minutum]|nr:MAG: peptidase C65 Otubain-domain-containing protein [Monoraphidium minutum]